MSRDDVFQVRHSSLPAQAEGTEVPAVINRLGLTVVVDFFTQLALSGLTYHVQMGTEDAGVAFTTSIDDQLVSMLADNNAGYSMIPLLFTVNPGVVAGATLAMAMLEVDMAKLRYSANGTLFVPRNLHAQAPASFNGVAYVAGSSDITTLAKSAVPDSVELARKDYIEDALANTIGYPGAWDSCVYSVKQRPMVATYGVSSLIGHVGSASADLTGYAVIEMAQLAIAQMNAT